MATKQTWLIQRLGKPYGDDWKGAMLNSMAFGGGGSGLSREAMRILSAVFSFDYMGAAEFEFGALPKSLGPFQRDAGKLVAFTLTLKPTEYGDGFERRFRKKTGTKVERSVYVLCRADDREYAEGVIRADAKKPLGLKEPTRLVDALDRIPGTDEERTRGWYELDNGFFFFTDREMWERTCALFGVEVPTARAA